MEEKHSSENMPAGISVLCMGVAMLVNLSDVLTSEGRREKREIPLEMTVFENSQGSFRITEKEPVSFVFTNIEAGKARIEGSLTLTFQVNCDRCLTEMPMTLTIDFEHYVYSPDAGSGDGDNEALYQMDDQSFMDGYQLDVEAFMYGEILVNWPSKILCRRDCRGICPKCGQNLNIADCGCDTFIPDPRMAAIQDIFNASKEV